MSQEKRSLVDRIRDMMDLLGEMLTPKQPAPQPIPVHNDKRRRQ